MYENKQKLVFAKAVQTTIVTYELLYSQYDISLFLRQSFVPSITIPKIKICSKTDLDFFGIVLQEKDNPKLFKLLGYFMDRENPVL